MDKYLVIIRHGDYGNVNCDDPPLSELGIEHIRNLKGVIRNLIMGKARAAGDENIRTLFFSFSPLRRAVQSVYELHWGLRDIIIAFQDETQTERRRILEPEKIVKKVIGLTDLYGTSVSVIVAHGDMPAVITETAHELATGKKHGELPSTDYACGFATNLVTGEVTFLRHDLLETIKS